jgi:hypothetical protein
MTPKEKAVQLVENFRLNVLDYEGCSINFHKAKQCALIAVEEIIDSVDNEHVSDIFTEYWQEVKQEIENL